MKLLVANESGVEGGGTEARVRSLLGALVARGRWEAIHLVQREEPRQAVEGVAVHVARDAREARDLTRRLLNQERMDLVQAHNMPLWGASPVEAARECGVPVIWFAHDYWGFCGRRTLIDRRKRNCPGAGLLRCSRCLSLPDALHELRLRPILQTARLGVAASHSLIGWYERHGMLRGRWRRVVPWRDERFFDLPERERAPVVLFVGPLASFKGAVLLAEAMREVAAAHPRWRLRYVGGLQEPGSPYRQAVEEAASRGGSPLGVEFAGFRSGAELVAELARASIYACPPLWQEPFGLNWAEAMLAGLPVVGTRIGGLTEYLEGRALLVQPDDSRALAAGIRRLIENPDEAERLAREGREWARQQFRLERAVEEMEGIYSQVLATPRRGGQ